MIVPGDKRDASSSGYQNNEIGKAATVLGPGSSVNSPFSASNTTTTSNSDAPPEYDTLSSLTTNSQTQEAETHALAGTVPPGPTTVATSPKAVNHVSINQPLGSIDCNYTIDPFIQLPRSFLPALAPGKSEESRKNLSLRTRVGGIIADITLWHDDSAKRNEKMEETNAEGKKKRIDIEMKTLVGTMCVKLRDPTPAPISNRPPFRLRCFARTGTLLIHLPTSFHGFISVTTTVGGVILSKNVQSTARWLDSGLRSRRCFIGDLARLSRENSGDEHLREAWTGDEVILETSIGTAEILYVDELSPVGGLKRDKLAYLLESVQSRAASSGPRP